MMRTTRRLTRRDCLARCAALAGAVRALAPPDPRQNGPRQAGTHASAAAIDSVTGPIAPDRLGLTLMHEHVLVDFIGADRVSASRYDADEVFRIVLPHLERVKRLGCRTLVECTPAYLGRDPRLLRRLSEASGVQILTNTGYYGAANDKHVPAHAFDETAEQLAARWVKEARQGIEETGIRPAFMKIGVDAAPLSAIDAKLVRAAALTHRETGLPIASHTGSGAAAMEELDLLGREQVAPAAFIWVHAQSERDEAFHLRVARRGAWVEFDGISEHSVDRHVALVQRLKAEGLLGHVLVSHDAGWYHVGEPGGGAFRSFDTLFAKFVPALKATGFSEGDTSQLLVDNPRRALVRRG
jgi:phosphotriesterase-related protein